MPIQRIGSIFLPVSDLERSIAFYSELGLVSRGMEDWGDGRRGATLFCDPHPEHAALLTLAEVSDPPAAWDHSVMCLNCSDVTGMHTELQGRGVRVTELETWDSPWNHHVMFDVYDPDGHRVNLIEMVPVTA
ncbi:VOC family protein [Paenibacillus mucilaginosus]|uniref:VOC domain-containing protein n=2 Tax=Paenibacillus mucilaginosus TaxID=61624 RepID=H6NP17_9BACL|nr:VOC family protein [Paenibacillus mucilaginosus]AEI43445.1 hypothetical protein KNP414_04920 [Paenibacillus mucilaginosus KNP414]AFC31091.1 hypothetical protein PM3016_4321 [Paenibacillus mucilaginosus 3016]MCG7212009.1 VOC family protein [Paenibacillus mucilaginosus]WDM25003.1 VOC family protein [Paenibacillus mucilaginosus]WFA19674.1 VOC family protein [Paenibacillus mucilaginosus]